VTLCARNGKRFVAAIANSSNGVIEPIAGVVAALCLSPLVKIVERVVEKVVIRHDPECIQSLAQARELISAAADRLTQRATEAATPVVLAQVQETGAFPTMAEVERAMILAAYQKSNRRPLEAARLLGIGKTTLYRKLREMGQEAA